MPKKTLTIDLKKELELFIHALHGILDPDIIMKLLTNRLVKKFGLWHAAIYFYDKENKRFVTTTSSGQIGSKVPVGYARFDDDNNFVIFFKEGLNFIVNKSGAVRFSDIKRALKNKSILAKDARFSKMLSDITLIMELLEIDVAIPGYLGVNRKRSLGIGRTPLPVGSDEELYGILVVGKKRAGASFSQDELGFLMGLSSSVALAIRNAKLYDRLKSIFYGIVKTFSVIMEKIDPYFTKEHMDRMVASAVKFINTLIEKGVIKEHNRDITVAGIFLHDIGKFFVPKEILHKDSRLTPEEETIMRRHVIDGEEVLSQIDELQEASLIIRHSHERWDGSGYPNGLKGNDIPLGARVAAILDAFDAMIHDRPYRKALNLAQAADELSRCSGKQFDPQLVKIFVETINGSKQVGSK